MADLLDDIKARLERMYAVEEHQRQTLADALGKSEKQLERISHTRIDLDGYVAATNELRVLRNETSPPRPGEIERRWMEVARAEIGTKEVDGSGNNPRIVEYLATTTLGNRPAGRRDSTPWCSAYVNWVLGRAGIEGTNSAMARSWLGWGVDPGEPLAGAVVILKRGKAPSGHVGFANGRVGSNHVAVLGGNQSDSVCIKRYSMADVLGFRMPEYQNA